MPRALDTLRVSTIAEESADAGMEVFEGLFGIQGHRGGDQVVRPGGKEPANDNNMGRGTMPQ